MGKENNELLEACRVGDFQTVQRILINQKSKKSAFHSLRRGGFGLNVQDHSGYNAIHHASLNGHTDIVELLLAHESINPMAVDSRGCGALHLAAWAGHGDICKLLLNHQSLPADANTANLQNETPLHYAAQHGHLTVLIELLAHGADPSILNFRDESPLDLGAQYGRLQIVQVLIRAHSDLLLPIKATSTPINHTALHLASKNGHHEIVQLLVAAGCNINITTPNGSALHVAALCGKEKVVKILLKEGINLDLTDCDGRTVFDVLDDFPAHVVQRIRNIINHYYQRTSVYENESESDDHIVVDRRSRKDHETVEYRMNSGRNSYQHEQQLNLNNHRYSGQSESMYGETSSPSSSMGSFGASSTGMIVPIKHKTSTVPSKPPRKSLSTSPPIHSRQLNLMTKSFEFDLNQDIELEPEQRPTFKCFKSQEELDEKKSSRSTKKSTEKKTTENASAKKKAPYEYLYMSQTQEPAENNNHDNQSSKQSSIKTSDDEKKSDYEYTIMSGPITIPKDYDNKIVRVMNPHRKLKKGTTNGMATSTDTDTYVTIRRNPNEPPLSPTFYPAPPTPDHAPPSASEAERYIYQRIRPLSQEYKRRNGQVDSYYKSTASSGSLHSSSVSLSSSTDCLEEFQGDAPFAGLMKGSTLNLDQQNNRSSILHQNMNNNRIKTDEKSLETLPSFNEQEEWAKISEIMESFGSGIVRESVFVNDIESEFKERLGLNSVDEAQNEPSDKFAEIKKWLVDIGLQNVEEHLIENGYDDIHFLNKIITSEGDLEICGIPEKDRHRLLSEIVKLPKPLTLAESNKVGSKSSQNDTLAKWLSSIHLEEYLSVFEKHFYVDMDKVHRVWEIELQAVLEINKIGHRRRILFSISRDTENDPKCENNNSTTSTSNNDTDSKSDANSNNETNSTNSSIRTEKKSEAIISSTSRHRNRKNRQAPQPPTQTNNLEIRQPSELLLTNQGNLNAQWKHTSAALVSESIKYEAFYLGSTIVKELKGTESTKKSIQKLKKSERTLSSLSPHHQNNSSLSGSRKPVMLRISHRGVQFIDVESMEPFCEHSIINIDCACQDAEDLTHFAYITKDFDNDLHYCHVFSVESMDLATEIILTIGQAFEVAYQLALRDASSAE